MIEMYVYKRALALCISIITLNYVLILLGYTLQMRFSTK